MVNDDRLPRTAYDLIELLDATVERMEQPSTRQGWERLDEATVRGRAFTAGARALVDQLVAQMKEEVEGDDAQGLSDGPPQRFARVLGEGADVHSVQLDPDGLVPPSPE